MVVVFGFAGDGRRSVPAVNDYERIETLKREGDWDKLSPVEQRIAQVYLETEVGTLICALRDGMLAAEKLPAGAATAATLQRMLSEEWAALFKVGEGG